MFTHVVVALGMALGMALGVALGAALGAALGVAVSSTPVCTGAHSVAPYHVRTNTMRRCFFAIPLLLPALGSAAACKRSHCFPRR